MVIVPTMSVVVRCPSPPPYPFGSRRRLVFTAPPDADLWLYLAANDWFGPIGSRTIRSRTTNPLQLLNHVVAPYHGPNKTHALQCEALCFEAAIYRGAQALAVRKVGLFQESTPTHIKRFHATFTVPTHTFTDTMEKESYRRMQRRVTRAWAARHLRKGMGVCVACDVEMDTRSTLGELCVAVMIRWVEA